MSEAKVTSRRTRHKRTEREGSTLVDRGVLRRRVGV